MRTQAYIDSHGGLITERRRVASHYLAHWFVPDLISVLPVGFIFGSWAEFTTLFKILRVIRIAKVRVTISVAISLYLAPSSPPPDYGGSLRIDLFC